MAEIKCPSCGSPNVEQVDAGKYQCPYCGTTFQAAAPQQPQSAYQQPQPQQAAPKSPSAGPGLFEEGPSGKSRGIFAILAFLLGYLGIHFFYVGNVKAGIMWLVLTLVVLPGISFVTLGFGAVLYFLYFLPVIQGIVALTAKQEDFERKYCDTTKLFPLF